MQVIQHLTPTEPFFKIVTTASGLYCKSLENGYPSRYCRVLFYLFSFSFAWACFPTVCPSAGFLNGLTTPSIEVLGQDICRFFAAMENAHRDWKAQFMQHCSEDFRIPLLHKSFNYSQFLQAPAARAQSTASLATLRGLINWRVGSATILSKIPRYIC